jgi:peptidoglycan/xylan/chitin deacetylase (PgdA/CDA1 family)
MYHHVGNPGGGRYNIAQASYEWQMDYLGQHGFTSVCIDQIAAALNGGPPLPPKPIAITFDDGWRHQLTNTLPSLVKNGLRATYFIVYNQSARLSGFLNFDQLRQLRDAGMWIGSHSVSHPNLRRAPALRLTFEVTASKQALEAVVEQPVTVFAYPGGSFDARVARAVQQAGYVAAVSVRGGVVQRADEIYLLRRTAIQGAMSQARFIALVEGPFGPTPTPTLTTTLTSTSTST